MVQSSNPHDIVELKGSSLAVVVLVLKNSESGLLYPQLDRTLEEGGSFLKNAPVVIDVAKLDGASRAALDYTQLAHHLREAGVLPVCVQGASREQEEAISAAGLLCLSQKNSGNSGTPKTPERAAPPTEEEQMEAPRAAAPPLIISHAVRAGQQINAPDGDLIVLGSVNAGSEIFAAGNIHVYGALRGRALAGVNGDTQARIFALRGDPALLAIAGEYVVNEELPPQAVDRSFAVSWSPSGLQFHILGSFEP